MNKKDFQKVCDPCAINPIELVLLKNAGKGVEKKRTSQDATLLSIYYRVKTQAPTVSEDGKSIVLPRTEDARYSVSLWGSSNTAVIGTDFRLTQPLEDMDVYLFYEVTNLETGESLHMDDPISVRVKGKYDAAQKNRPCVLPAIREWKGEDGTFAFGGRIAVADGIAYDAALIVRSYIEGMMKTEVTLTREAPQCGDICLTLVPDLALCDEGYVMVIDDVLEIKASAYKGLVYAGASLTQMLMQSGNALPKGMMRDYPQYGVRSVMLDVARFYMPLDYLIEVTKYAAFFKLSEFHVHINDNQGEQTHAFRVESKRYPALNSGIAPEHVYTQEDYKAYQKEMRKYGIDVVTEIDTPAHARCVGAHDPSLMLSGSMINVENPDAVAFVKSLFDEFLDGEDPVLQSKKFHIGVDEYEWQKAEQVRAYLNEISEYVAAKGIHPVVWCSLNDTPPTGKYQGYGGTTPVSTTAIQEYYSKDTAKLPLLLEGGYHFISAEGRSLYIVPVGPTGFHDGFDLEKLYRGWEVGNVTPDEAPMRQGHPLLLGAEACVWYDSNVGCTEFDIFGRSKEQIVLMSEKCWLGEKSEGSTYEDFQGKVDTLAAMSPLANPARFVSSASDLIADYDLSTLANGQIKDRSANGYDATATDLALDAALGGVLLDGKGCISLPFRGVAFPYAVSFALQISEYVCENAVFFGGRDGALLLNVDGTGKIGLSQKGYVLIFDHVLPMDQMTQYRIECRKGKICLYANGELAAQAENYKSVYEKPIREGGCPTFVLPTEQIGLGIKGCLRSLRIEKL